MRARDYSYGYFKVIKVNKNHSKQRHSYISNIANFYTTIKLYLHYVTFGRIVTPGWKSYSS